MARKPQFTRTKVFTLIPIGRIEMVEHTPKIVETASLRILGKVCEYDTIKISKAIRKTCKDGNWVVCGDFSYQVEKYAMSIELFYDCATLEESYTTSSLDLQKEEDTEQDGAN